ncbi:Gfo/Idh/MocA family oxidoreductase [Thermodesulfobacteriota bacterium]
MPTTSSPTQTKIAVVGSGYWGKNLVRNFYQLGALKLICDKDEAMLAGFKDEYPDVERCIAFNDVLSRPDIDGVVIATPAETHYNLTREALRSQKHVFVEKPLALSVPEGKELIALAAETQRVLMVGHLLQYHPAFVKLKKLANSGELGRINYIYSNRLNLGKIRREENILWSFAPHDISMILSLAGEAPEAVVATGGNYLHKKIADVTTTHLEFPSGLRAHIFVSWLHPFKEQKLIVVGDSKMAVFDDTQLWPDKLRLYPHQIKWENNIPVPSKADPERLEIAEAEPLRCECKHFVECITNGRVPITDGQEGLQVLAILNASQHSIDNHSRIINLSNLNRSLSAISPEPTAKNEDFFVHETTVVDSDVSIGPGTKIWHFSHILSGSKIGRHCNIGQNVVIGPDVVLGNNCKIQNNVSIYKGVILEEGVFCGPSMVFTNVYNPRAEIRKMDQLRPTLVKRGTTIGANATIICGLTLGRYAFIGAGAMVNKNVPDHALVVGNPAKQIGWMCECGERLSEDLECSDCGKMFAKNGTAIKLKSESS